MVSDDPGGVRKGHYKRLGSCGRWLHHQIQTLTCSHQELAPLALPVDSQCGLAPMDLANGPPVTCYLCDSEQSPAARAPDSQGACVCPTSATFGGKLKGTSNASAMYRTSETGCSLQSPFPAAGVEVARYQQVPCTCHQIQFRIASTCPDMPAGQAAALVPMSMRPQGESLARQGRVLDGDGAATAQRVGAFDSSAVQDPGAFTRAQLGT
jgi:hypothetical protein